MTKKKTRLTKQEVKAMQAYQYCQKVFAEMEINKKTDTYKNTGATSEEVIIKDEETYQLYLVLLKLDVLSKEESLKAQEAIESYEKGTLDENDYELVDNLITDTDLNKLEEMFKNKRK